MISDRREMPGHLDGQTQSLAERFWCRLLNTEPLKNRLIESVFLFTSAATFQSGDSAFSSHKKANFLWATGERPDHERSVCRHNLALGNPVRLHGSEIRWIAIGIKQSLTIFNEAHSQTDEMRFKMADPRPDFGESGERTPVTRV